MYDYGLVRAIGQSCLGVIVIVENVKNVKLLAIHSDTKMININIHDRIYGKFNKLTKYCKLSMPICNENTMYVTHILFRKLVILNLCAFCRYQVEFSNVKIIPSNASMVQNSKITNFNSFCQIEELVTIKQHANIIGQIGHWYILQTKKNKPYLKGMFKSPNNSRIEIIRWHCGIKYKFSNTVVLLLNGQFRQYNNKRYINITDQTVLMDRFDINLQNLINNQCYTYWKNCRNIISINCMFICICLCLIIFKFVLLLTNIDTSKYERQYYECKQVSSLKQLLAKVNSLNQSDKAFLDEHCIQLQGVRIELMKNYYFISGKCNKCNRIVNGYNIQRQLCPNTECSNVLKLEEMKEKWFFAKFRCVNVNQDDDSVYAMGTHLFTTLAIKKMTQSRICNINEYAKLTKNNILLHSILRKIHPIIMNVIIIAYKKQNKTTGKYQTLLKIDVID